MYWLIIFITLLAVVAVFGLIALFKDWYEWFKILMIVIAVFDIFVLFIPMSYVARNIEDKYDWYIETRLKYAEAEGIEKEYLEMTDVMTYNLWYTENKEDLENPWNFKSATGCEFDYIKVGD